MKVIQFLNVVMLELFFAMCLFTHIYSLNSSEEGIDDREIYLFVILFKL